MGAARRVVLALALSVTPACGPAPDPSSPVARKANEGALAVADSLEELIASGSDRPEDRATAYEIVTRREEPTADYAYARAVVAGRLAEARGVTGASLVGEVERFAMRSIALDPDFRAGAATRLLATLYVYAPATMLAHGDSEEGLELIEALTARYPEDPENQLRLAEARIALGDLEPAHAPLCAAFSMRDRLRPDHRVLLDRLFEDADAGPCEAPAGGAP
jgi:hypothetical protein